MYRSSLRGLSAAECGSRGGAEDRENLLHGDRLVSAGARIRGSHVLAASATVGQNEPSGEERGAVGPRREAKDEGIFGEDVHVRREGIAREVYPAPRLSGHRGGKGLAKQAPQVRTCFLA